MFRKKPFGLYCSTGKALLTIDDNLLEFVDNKIFEFMDLKKSRLSNAFLDFKDIKNFCKIICQRSKKIYFNHLGVCYQVKSKKGEKIRLSRVAKNKGFNFYEAPSSDLASLWLFMGDISTPTDPIIEFLPVEKVNDYYLDYWLPHVHFAFNTSLSADEIKYAVHEVLKGNRSAIPTIVVENIIYHLRVWLGVISGINFHLDLLIDKPGNSLLETRQLLEKISS
jgi:hypothetical protein